MISEPNHEFQKHKELIRFVDYVFKFNELFYSGLNSYHEKKEFIDGLEQEKFTIVKNNDCSFLDYVDKNLQKQISEMAYHKKMISFYASYGLSFGDYFYLNNLRIEIEKISILPKKRSELISIINLDIQNLRTKSTSDSFLSKSTLENLLNGFLRYFQIKNDSKEMLN